MVWGTLCSIKGLWAWAAYTEKGKLNESPGQGWTGGQGSYWAGNIWTKWIWGISIMNSEIVFIWILVPGPIELISSRCLDLKDWDFFFFAMSAILNTTIGNKPKHTTVSCSFVKWEFDTVKDIKSIPFPVSYNYSEFYLIWFLSLAVRARKLLYVIRKENYIFY